MRKKVLITIFCASVILAIFAIGLSYFNQPSEEEIVEAEKQIETVFITEIEDKDTELFSEYLIEDQMQQIIHSMSHQKVKADHKWGKIIITQERIALLINAVEENKASWENSKLYLDILNRWHEGDFSKADEDHNVIWELQGGNIGRAEGLLNAIEEQKYLDSEE